MPTPASAAAANSSCPPSTHVYGAPYTWVVGAQLLLAAAALAGVGIARYYALVTLATLVSLRNYLRRGVPATWEAAEGTR